jgi:hypothetical protein
MSNTNCSQPGCQIETSGQCLEGFGSTTCPYLAHSEHSQDENASYSAQELVDLPSGEALTSAQAAEITRDHVSKVIIIAGPLGSGKTTILTSLFEAFLEAPFANYLFRGSRTLIGFERRCHLGREESGSESADTTHTSVREGIVFLHLDLAPSDWPEFEHEHILLSDISGELFRRLRDSSDTVKDFPAFRRANHLCLVLDGEKIAHRDQRHVARNDSRSILRSLIESGMIASGCVIDVAFTKWDAVVEAMGAGMAEEITGFIESTKSTLQALSKDFEFRFHEVAARPAKEAKVPFAHGLPTLLRSWMEHDNIPAVRIPVFSIVKPEREFWHFTDVTIIENELENQYNVRRL